MSGTASGTYIVLPNPPVTIPGFPAVVGWNNTLNQAVPGMTVTLSAADAALALSARAVLPSGLPPTVSGF